MSEQTKETQREIAIFWDYENVPLPNSYNVAQAAKAIVDTVSPYGRIVDRRLYCGNSQPRDCSSLDSSGFDLVVTPTRNQKESLDKKLIADVLTFAWDSAVRNDNTKPCVVLLTGDGDYAYTLSKLRDRGIMTIVMVGRDCTVASILVETADVALSLEDDVLSVDTTKSSPFPASKLTLRMSSSGPDQDTLMLTICRSIQSLTASAENRDGWTDFGKIALIVQQKIRQGNPNGSPDFVKQQARNARQRANSNGLIELGRRKLATNGFQREIVPWNSNRANLSAEVYARLLPKGEQLILQGRSSGLTTPTNSPYKKMITPTRTDEGNKTLFIRNLPRGADVRDFVAVLQDSFPVTIRRARLDYPKSSNICNAVVECMSVADASAVLQGANRAAGGTGLVFQGQFLGAFMNTRYNPFAGAPKFPASKTYYKSNENSNASVSSLQTTEEAQDYDASDDTKIFCRAVDLACRQQNGTPDDWTNAGAVGNSFRSLLPPARVEAKEEMNIRFKKARNNSIREGLVEMGRRQLQNSFHNQDFDSYVAVALDEMGTTYNRDRSLSSEVYFRLLTAGTTLADETPNEIEVFSSPNKIQPNNKCIFMNNLPLSTTATQLVQYLSSLDCPIQRVELQEGAFKGVLAIVAHVECVHAEDAVKIIRQAKAYELVYLGHKIYAIPNRMTPDDIASTTSSSSPNMTYTREQTSPMGNTVETEVTDVTENSSLDNITPGSEELVQLMDPDNNSSDDENSNNNNNGGRTIMRQYSSSSIQKDPFEDLLWK